MSDSLLRQAGEAIVQLLPFTVLPTSLSLFTKVESFKEMNAGRCLGCDRSNSKWDDETYALSQYRSLLVLLDDIYRTVFMV